MIPVVTPDEMRAIDEAASDPVETLIDRAGAAVALSAIDLLGGRYGRMVNVIAGKGNNGADGREAARRLTARGVKVRIFEAADRPDDLPAADLVIDAAYGTGYRATPDRHWVAPDVGDAMVLAVDVPSGIDALDGSTEHPVLRADRTVTFQALKPGLLFGDGARLAGDVEVVDIGLDVSRATCHLVERSDVAGWWPDRAVDAHKWNGAVKVVAGSPGMPGAAELCTAAAARSGSGLVSLSAPGCTPGTRSEVIQRAIPTGDFANGALGDIERFGSLVIGPGLGRDDDIIEATRRCIAEADLPVVVDGDAIHAVASGDDPAAVLLGRRAATVLTPHDGEFERLTGAGPGPDRVESARHAANAFDATVLLKGPTTVIASPTDPADDVGRTATPGADVSGRVLLVDRGDERLATAGSGDVLSGIIGSLLAAGVPANRAAAAGAWIHAAAAELGHRRGLLAGDIIDLLPEAIDMLG